jgi:hypothetical protein
VFDDRRPPDSAVFLVTISQMARFSGENVFGIKYVFSVPLQLLSETSLSISGTGQRNVNTDVLWPSRNVSDVFVQFYQT